MTAPRKQQLPTAYAEQKFYQLPIRPQTQPVLTLHQIPKVSQLTNSASAKVNPVEIERVEISHSARQKDNETEVKKVPCQTRNLPF